MKVYFYHTQNIQYCLRRMAEGEFPSHFLYGACHLADNGVDVVYHRSPKHELSRLKTALYTAWRVLTCRERFDAIYATHYKGLELVVLLRALGLFRKPIVVWHHQPIVKSKSRLRELLGRFFYKGFDRLIFFSQKLVDDSLKAPKADPRKLVVGHWGADLAFYDKIKAELKAEQLSPSHPNDSQLSTLNSKPSTLNSQPSTLNSQLSPPHHNTTSTSFIATGKEQRDQPTLIEAFNRTGRHLILYIGINPNPNVPNPNLEAVERCKPADNIDVVKICGLLPYEIAREVAKADCVVICCHRTRYTAGLTTVVEALALSLPIICSRNPQIPVDFDSLGCGTSVEYGDVEGWQRAVEYIASHPEEARKMGCRGRELAERMFNDERCAKEVAEVIKEFSL